MRRFSFPVLPPLTRSTHTLPFDLLAPDVFERLCLWLVEREGFSSVEYIGEAGADEGRDIVGRLGGEVYVFQCKRVRRFPPTAAEEAVRKILTTSPVEPSHLVLIVSCPVSRRARQRARETWGSADTCSFWAGAELDEKVKRHPEILIEFFSLGAPLPSGLEPLSSPSTVVQPLTYPDEWTERLAAALDDAYLREEALLLANQDARAVREEILELRRQLRTGGRLRVGDRLLEGRLKLVDCIGSGGFGTVWRAYDRAERAIVAVKVLHGEYADGGRRRDRFFRGAHRMAQLQHHGIVRVIQPEGHDGHFHFFIMEYVSGGDLRQFVLSRRPSKATILPILRKVGEAIEFAHSRGVIHRDIKPDNILLTASGEPKLTDFDLVRALNSTAGTRTGMLGTVVYAAPEAMEDASQAGPEADIYSLGMTALFAFYGQDLPLDVLRDTKDFVQRLSLDSQTRSVLARAVSWEGQLRWRSAGDFVAALENNFRSNGDEIADAVGTPGDERSLRVMRPRSLRSRILSDALGRLVRRTFRISSSVVVSIVLLATAVLFLPNFALQRLQVTAGPRVTERWVQQQLEVFAGKPLLLVSNAAVSARLEHNRWIRGITIEKRLPDTLVVRITEGTEVAIAKTDRSTFFVDKEGHALGTASTTEYNATSLLVIELLGDRAKPRTALDLHHEIQDVAPSWAEGVQRISILNEEDAIVHSEELCCPLLLSTGVLSDRMPALAEILPEMDRYQEKPTIDIRNARRFVLSWRTTDRVFD